MAECRVSTKTADGQSLVGAIVSAQEQPAPRLVRSDAAWYILRSGPSQEFLAGHDLRGSGYRVFIPREKKWRALGPGRRKVCLGRYPRFPTYLFAKLAYPHKPQSRFVRAILSMDDVPIPLASGEIERLRRESRRSVAHVDSVPLHRAFEAGQSVRVVAGAFRDFYATLDAIDEAGAHITVQLFGRPTPVPLPLTWLEAA